MVSYNSRPVVLIGKCSLGHLVKVRVAADNIDEEMYEKCVARGISWNGSERVAGEECGNTMEWGRDFELNA